MKKWISTFALIIALAWTIVGCTTFGAAAEPIFPDLSEEQNCSSRSAKSVATKDTIIEIKAHVKRAYEYTDAIQEKLERSEPIQTRQVRKLWSQYANEMKQAQQMVKLHHLPSEIEKSIEEKYQQFGKYCGNAADMALHFNTKGLKSNSERKIRRWTRACVAMQQIFIEDQVFFLTVLREMLTKD